MVKATRLIQLYQRHDGLIVARNPDYDRDARRIIAMFRSKDYARWYLKLEFPGAEIRE